jgi:hypothetical protein
MGIIIFPIPLTIRVEKKLRVNTPPLSVIRGCPCAGLIGGMDFMRMV